MNKIPKYVVIIVGILVMVVLLPLGYVRYKTRYEAEQISVSTSPDGDYGSAEIKDIYAYVFSSGEVISSGKTNWEDTGTDEFERATE